MVGVFGHGSRPRVLADNHPEQTSDRHRMNLQGELRLYDRGRATAWPICLPSCVLRPLGTARRLAAVHLPSYRHCRDQRQEADSSPVAARCGRHHLVFRPRSDRLSHLPARRLDYGEHRRQDHCRLRLAPAQNVPRSVLAGCSARLRGHHWVGGGPSSTCSSSSLSLCGKSSELVDTDYSRSRQASVSGPPQFSRQHFSAILTTATRERIGSDCLTPAPLDCWPASCCVEPAISGCRSDFTWPSTGSRHTSMVWPTVAISCPVIF